MTDTRGLARARDSGLIINTDQREYQLLLQRRHLRRREEQASREVDSLRREVSDLKDALNKVLEAIGKR